MAAYSRVATQPQVAIIKYIGKIASSYQKNSRKMSNETNTHSTPATSSKKNAINSRVRSSIFHEIRTPQKPTNPVSKTSGALVPSAPTWKLTPMDGIQGTLNSCTK